MKTDRVALVAMPWHFVEMPSLALGVLKATIEHSCPDVEVLNHHPYVPWLDLMCDTLGQPAALDAYEAGLGAPLGEWVFSAALHRQPHWRVEEFRAYAQQDRGPEQLGVIESLVVLHRLAGEFVDHTAAAVLQHDPCWVGLSVTFAQLTASLALAKAIREMSPSTPIVFGGGCCHGPRARAILEAYPCIDVVAGGEGEAVVGELTRAVLSGEGFSKVPGIDYRDLDGISSTVPVSRTDLWQQREPDYNSFFATLRTSPIGQGIAPRIGIESSRGCWWGESSHCTFCGLNGESMQYRDRAGTDTAEVLASLAAKHDALDIAMTDNVMESSKAAGMTAVLREQDWDLRIHYEIRPTVAFDELAQLLHAGVTQVQPGIENLNHRVLRLMRKGVTGARNVALLRDCEQLGTTVLWNFLYGFPGEDPADYADVFRQIRNLTHLQPPRDTFRIALVRDSPYFDDPSLGITPVAAARHYQLIHDLDHLQMMGIAGQFEYREQGIDTTTVEQLNTSVQSWKDAYPHSSLYSTPADHGGTEIVDQRHGRPPATHHLATGFETDSYSILAAPAGISSLQHQLRAAGHEISTASLSGWLGELRGQGLVYQDGGAYVSLAPSAYVKWYPPTDYDGPDSRVRAPSQAHHTSSQEEKPDENHPQS